MLKTIRARVVDGALRPVERLDLEEGSEIMITLDVEAEGLDDAVNRDTLLESLDVQARLDELREIRDGWLDGGGKAPSHAGLDWMSDCFEGHFPGDLPLPHLYPTPEGGIEAEWSLGRDSVIFEFDVEKRRGDWLRFDKKSDDEETRELDMDDVDSWAWFAGEIRRMAGTSM